MDFFLQHFEVFPRAPFRHIAAVQNRVDVDGEGSAQKGYIAGNDTKHGEKEDILEINKKTGLLKLTCNNEITANKCAAYFKLPLPFPYTN